MRDLDTTLAGEGPKRAVTARWSAARLAGRVLGWGVGLALYSVLVYGVVWWLPFGWEVDATVTIEAPPEAVRPWLELQRWPEWQESLHRSELALRLCEPLAPAEQTQLRWGHMGLQLTEERDGVLRYRYDWDNEPTITPNTITVALSGDGDRTHVGWHAEGRRWLLDLWEHTGGGIREARALSAGLWRLKHLVEERQAAVSP